MSEETWGFRSRRELLRHFDWHSNEYPGLKPEFVDADAYGKAALAFLKTHTEADIVECTQRSTGKRQKYHKATQEYMSITPIPETFIITYFFKDPRPSQFRNNLNYFYRMCRE